MYHLIVFLPLIGFLIAGLGGRQIGAKASEYVTSSLLVISAALSWVAFFSVALGDTAGFTVPVLRFIQSGTLDVDWGFRIDTLTVVMLVVVTPCRRWSTSIRSATCTTIRTGRASSPICRCSPSPC
jgi:NADH-quinone oxidoreductase subunit L